MSTSKEHMRRIRVLVGNITEEDLRYVDSFVGERAAMFMPQGGACFYALASLHTHPSYMFVLPFNDQTSIELDGRVIQAEAGKLSAYSPNVPHTEMPSDVPPRYVAIMIEPGLFDDAARHYTEKPLKFRGESFPAGQSLRDIIRRFMQEADSRLPGAGAVLRALETELCHAILREATGVKPGHDRVSARMEIDRAIEYMHEHLSEKISIDKIASAASMSRSHFMRVFRSETGTSPMDYLGTMRLERAKKLLGAGEMSIAEVALASGFSSPSHLTERFTRKFGVSPSLYRKSIISKEKDTTLKD